MSDDGADSIDVEGDDSGVIEPADEDDALPEDLPDELDDPGEMPDD